MPRKLRVEYPGAIYHAMSRGNGRQNIFRGDVDRQDFLKTLKRVTHWRERSRAKKRLPQTAFLLKAVFVFGRCGRRARQQRLCELAHGHAAQRCRRGPVLRHTVNTPWRPQVFGCIVAL